MMKRLLLACFIGLVALSLSGCFLRLVLGAQVVESLSEQLDLYFSALEANATTGVCRPDPFGGGVECLYTFEDPAGFTQTTSTAQLVSEFGLFGVIIDPLVLELPAGVTNIAGTFNDRAGSSGDVLIYPGLSFVPVDDTRPMAAAPGKQLVIVDLPAGAPVDGVTYTYTLRFEQRVPAGTSPAPVKALLTGKVQVLGKTFYPPMLPCTSDLAAVPSFTLPTSATLQPVALPSGLSGCSDTLYTYFDPPRVCDLDNDQDIDQVDVGLIMAVRNMAADPGDPRDINADGVINANDARRCTLQCTRSRCAS